MTSTLPLLPSESAIWRGLAAIARDSATRIRLGDGAGHGAQAPLSACGIEIDDRRRALTPDALELLLALADERQLGARRDAMLAGEVVNRSEGRAALHALLRDFGGVACRRAPEAARQSVLRTRARMPTIESEMREPVIQRPKVMQAAK